MLIALSNARGEGRCGSIVVVCVQCGESYNKFYGNKIYVLTTTRIAF